jgi:deferrochelatase/peroxidase EfeB
MRERNDLLGDVGESHPDNWDMPTDGGEFHIRLHLMAPDEESFAEKLAIGGAAMEGLTCVHRVARQDLTTPANMREHVGFRDGISRPFRGAGRNTYARAGRHPCRRVRPGVRQRTGRDRHGPGPACLWRNGTYLSIRKLHQKVALFRRYLDENASDVDGQELLAAKMVGRWRSGCPLAKSPERDDPAIADDPMRTNDFAYHDDDPRGVKTPVGSHIRRANPRDALRTRLQTYACTESCDAARPTGRCCPRMLSRTTASRAE